MLNPLIRFVSGLAIANALAIASVHAGEGSHALIIGISTYSASSGADPLPGVPHDVKNARRMATAMGVDPKSIVELRDGEATKERILKELQSLRGKVQSGDRVLVYFSGHGTRMETADGCREGLSTYTGDMLTEEELAKYTQPISRQADKLLVMVDACFSGGVIRSGTRSLLGDDTMRPKFSTGASQTCATPVNEQKSRSLLSKLKRLGVQEENFVQIAAANFNEVSWDNKDFGGLATHALSQCLLGEAKDLNGSGAVSLDEVRACAQSRMDELMRPHRAKGMLPSTLQIKGNRNLIVLPSPLAVPIVSPPPLAELPKPPAVVALPPPAPVALAPPVAPEKPVQLPVLVAVPPPAPSPPAVTVVPQPPPVNPPAAPPPVALVQQVEVDPPVVGSRATLEEIFQQRDPRRRVEVLAPPKLKIGADPLRFTVKSSVEGYLYAVMLGSDEKSFYLLFPNKLDPDNRIRANQPYAFPRPGWRVVAGGPVGVNRMLFVVSKSPRDARVFVPDDASGGGPYTFSLADLKSRQRLTDFFLGRGVKGRNAAMGATLVDIQEVE